MKLGIDIDGVLADWNHSFIETIIAETGEDRFPPRPFEIPCWDYPQYYRYTEAQIRHVWDAIRADPSWWRCVEPYAETRLVLHTLRSLVLDGGHDVCFITDRKGARVKTQTEQWLQTYNYWPVVPTVLLTANKGMVVAGLELDWFLDDKPEHVLDAIAARVPRVYLLDRSWNREACGAMRVSSVLDAFTTFRDGDVEWR